MAQLSNPAKWLPHEPVVDGMSKMTPHLRRKLGDLGPAFPELRKARLPLRPLRAGLTVLTWMARSHGLRRRSTLLMARCTPSNPSKSTCASTESAASRTRWPSSRRSGRMRFSRIASTTACTSWSLGIAVGRRGVHLRRRRNAPRLAHARRATPLLCSPLDSPVSSLVAAHMYAVQARPT
jgi:hypothetical protein